MAALDVFRRARLRNRSECQLKDTPSAASVGRLDRIAFPGPERQRQRGVCSGWNAHCGLRSPASWARSDREQVALNARAPCEPVRSRLTPSPPPPSGGVTGQSDLALPCETTGCVIDDAVNASLAPRVDRTSAAMVDCISGSSETN